MNAPHHHLGDELLNSWLDGVATDAERRLVEHHITTCDACRKSLDSLMLVKQALSELPEPALPRSFQLTPEQAKKPTPIRSNPGSSNIVQMVPLVRMLSVAAVIAFLIFGGAIAFGPVSDAITTDDQQVSMTDVTDASDSAFEDADAAIPPPMSALPIQQIDEGQVISQGDAATGGDTAARALDEMAQERDDGVASAEPADDSNLLTIATITAGVIAIAATALWFGLSRVNRQSMT